MNQYVNSNACYGIILLAAGSSQRMGAINKLLATPPHGTQQSILKRSAKLALDSNDANSLASYLTVVSGYAHADVQAELDSLVIDCAFNPEADSGMASSLKVGLHDLQNKAAADVKRLDFIIVCLADMPHIKPETINQLIDARLADTTRDFIVPVFKGQRGNPVLIGQVFFDAVNTLTGDIGARQLIRNNLSATLELPVSDSGVLKDYDLPSDFD